MDAILSDLETMQEEEVSNITIHPDQSLLLRCRITSYTNPNPRWDHDGVIMDNQELACLSDSQEVPLTLAAHLSVA